MSRSNLDLIVSIVLYNTPSQEVHRVVEQILTSDLALHIFLIDNSPDPVDLSQIRSEWVTIVLPGENLGYGRGHNIAILDRGLQARYHLVLNSDVSLEPGVLQKLTRFMDDHAEIGLVMPNVVYPDGKPQHLCRLLPSPIDLISKRFLSRFDWAKRRHRRYELKDWSHNRVADIPFLSGCFMFMRRATVQKIGGFDERFFLYGEDTDLSRRLHLISRTVFYPNVTVTHEYRSEANRNWRQLLLTVRGLATYFNKWGWLVDRERGALNKACLNQLS